MPQNGHILELGSGNGRGGSVSDNKGRLEKSSRPFLFREKRPEVLPRWPIIGKCDAGAKAFAESTAAATMIAYVRIGKSRQIKKDLLCR